jgi:transcriptional regulator with XRE-family HTH domain
MDKPGQPRGLPYQARARLADNLFLQRKRAGLSQEALAKRAMVCATRIGAIEKGQSAAMLATYVRLAGSLGITLDDLLAGVSWTPGVVELEYDAGYEVEFRTEFPADS